MNCDCCGGTGVAPKGALINKHRLVSSRLLAMRARLAELEKQSRKTPPRHLTEARARVTEAKAAVVALRESIASHEDELRTLASALTEVTP